MAVFQIRAKKPATGELVDLVYDNEKSRLTYAATGESAVMVMQVAGREVANGLRHQQRPEAVGALRGAPR